MDEPYTSPFTVGMWPQFVALYHEAFLEPMWALYESLSKEDFPMLTQIIRLSVLFMYEDAIDSHRKARDDLSQNSEEKEDDENDTAESASVNGTRKHTASQKLPHYPCSMPWSLEQGSALFGSPSIVDSVPESRLKEEQIS